MTSTTKRIVETTKVTANPPGGLTPFSGNWTYELAAHLLRRTTFGPTPELINEAITLGLEQTIQTLFEDSSLPNPPLNYFAEDDPLVPVGEPWLAFPYYEDINVRFNRRKSVFAWTIENLINEKISVKEKLTLFWHNHFPVDTNEPHQMYRYISLLRASAWGDFKQLVKDITIDPAMLRYLNGNTNTDNNPNENYSRELLELFTIGKGPQVDEGDYTTYTEDDVLAMAKVLTGWDDFGYYTEDMVDDPLRSEFLPNRHETADKQLSHRFDNIIISDAGADEYKQLIDIIFTKEEVSKFICRKLYRWFVYYKISDTIELEVIEPMAQILREHNYEIKPALQALLSSEHFYGFLNRGPMINSPLDYSISILKRFEVDFGTEQAIKFQLYYKIWQINRDMQQEYFEPPDVAGWKAYYQEPIFYRSWINAVTLAERAEFAERMADRGYSNSGFSISIDRLNFLATKIDEPTDPNKLIDQLAVLLFPNEITDEQKAALKDILIPGLPDYEWTVEYNDHLANPDDNNLKRSVESKLEDLFNAMLSMPEAFLI